jgi:hypothetical protein
MPKILVVSHSAWIVSALKVMLSKPLSFKVMHGVDLKAHLTNTCVMTVRIWQSSQGRWQGMISSFGDVRHLKGRKEPEVEAADLVQ